MRESNRAAVLKASLNAARTEYQQALASAQLAAALGAGSSSASRTEAQSQYLDVAYGRYLEALAEYLNYVREAGREPVEMSPGSGQL